MGFRVQNDILLTLIIILAAMVLACIFWLIFRRKHFLTALKVLTLVYFAWAFFRYLLSDSFIIVVGGGLLDTSLHIEISELMQSIIRWGQYTSYVVLPMAVFFDSRLFKKLAVYTCIPFAIASAAIFKKFMPYFMAEGVKNSITGPLWFRSFYFAFELILAIAIPLLLIIKDPKALKFDSKKEVGIFFLVMPFIALALIPIYAPQTLIGYTKFKIEAFTLGNIIWISITLAEIVALFLIFRFKTYRERYMLCMFLSLALFLNNNSLFLTGITIQMPIQVCYLSAYFFVLALLIKNRAFFNFTFLVNLVATILAMAAPETSGGFAELWNFQYIIQHMQVLVIPLLCMLLRIFPRLSKRALKHLCIGYSVYFLFCFVSGTLLNGFADLHKQGLVNFFLMFDINAALKWFSFLSFTKSYEWVLFGRFHIYPVFQIIIYAGFLALCMLIYLAVIKLYDVLDDHFELRRARIALYEKRTGKVFKGPKEYPDDSAFDKEAPLKLKRLKKGKSVCLK